MKMDSEIKYLVEVGKRKGFLTYDEVNRLLPDEVVSGDKIDSILNMLEEMGIELADDDDELGTRRRTRRRAASDDSSEEPEDAEGEDDAEEEEAVQLFLQGPGTEKIDDPVRMYLTQMGEIPLLTRKRYRKKVLESGVAQEESIKTLKEVVRGELAFDRTLKISSAAEIGKEDVSERLPESIRTLENMLLCNRADFPKLQRTKAASKAHNEVVRRIRDRRRKSVLLLEELCLQTKKDRKSVV